MRVSPSSMTLSSGSCPCRLRLMFRDLSRPVCVVSISRSSHSKHVFNPSSKPPGRHLSAPPPLPAMIIGWHLGAHTHSHVDTRPALGAAAWPLDLFAQ